MCHPQIHCVFFVVKIIHCEDTWNTNEKKNFNIKLNYNFQVDLKKAKIDRIDRKGFRKFN